MAKRNLSFSSVLFFCVMTLLSGFALADSGAPSDRVAKVRGLRAQLDSRVPEQDHIKHALVQATQNSLLGLRSGAGVSAYLPGDPAVAESIARAYAESMGEPFLALDFATPAGPLANTVVVQLKNNPSTVIFVKNFPQGGVEHANLLSLLLTANEIPVQFTQNGQTVSEKLVLTHSTVLASGLIGVLPPSVFERSLRRIGFASASEVRTPVTESENRIDYLSRWSKDAALEGGLNGKVLDAFQSILPIAEPSDALLGRMIKEKIEGMKKQIEANLGVEITFNNEHKLVAEMIRLRQFKGLSTAAVLDQVDRLIVARASTIALRPDLQLTKSFNFDLSPVIEHSQSVSQRAGVCLNLFR